VDERSSDQLGFIVGRGSSHDERLTDARTESKKEHIAPFATENAVVFTYHVIDVHVKSLAFIGSAEAGHACARRDVHCRGTFAMFGEPENWFFKCGLEPLEWNLFTEEERRV